MELEHGLVGRELELEGLGVVDGVDLGLLRDAPRVRGALREGSFGDDVPRESPVPRGSANRRIAMICKTCTELLQGLLSVVLYYQK